MIGKEPVGTAGIPGQGRCRDSLDEPDEPDELDEPDEPGELDEPRELDALDEPDEREAPGRRRDPVCTASSLDPRPGEPPASAGSKRLRPSSPSEPSLSPFQVPGAQVRSASPSGPASETDPACPAPR